MFEIASPFSKMEYRPF